MSFPSSAFYDFHLDSARRDFIVDHVYPGFAKLLLDTLPPAFGNRDDHTAAAARAADFRTARSEFPGAGNDLFDLRGRNPVAKQPPVKPFFLKSCINSIKVSAARSEERRVGKEDSSRER